MRFLLYLAILSESIHFYMVMLPKMVGDVEYKERKVGRTAALSLDYFPFFLLSFLRKVNNLPQFLHL